ncbi:MAG: methionine--tRNA ligase [Phycisphaerales bacterium]
MTDAHPAHAPYYITTPIYYVNDRPHVGHCYTTLVADAAARLMRVAGRDVFFLTGTDEHAEKVVESAAKNGVTPIEWADRNADEFQRAFELMAFTNDDFIRTTQDRHTRVVQALIAKLQESGDVYLGDYVGWYDPSQEEYLTETVAKEHDYKSPVTGRDLEKRTEQNYFFRLSAYADRLRAHIEAHPLFIQPEARRNEVLGRLGQGLADVPISRAVKEGDTPWGIFMPGDESHRVYVWIDALINYWSAIQTDERTKYWPAQVHVLAKDILWFHAVIWPCMLMALGQPLPHIVYAHSFWIREGRKMSKSLGNFIDLPTMQAYIDRYSLDALRWYLLTQGPLGTTDADFVHAKFIDVYNADLANGIGNAASRVANMIAKYFDGAVPEVTPERALAQGHGRDWPSLTKNAVTDAIERMERFDVAGALRAGLELSNEVDRYIHETAPFKLAKDPANLPDVAAILINCAEALVVAANLLWPAMPASMTTLLSRFGCPAPDQLDGRDALCAWGAVKAGTPIEKGEALFPRADGDEAPPDGG